MATAVDDIRAITGRIDLVHCNDSRDEFDSGADRHTNLGEGLIDPDELAGAVRAAGSSVVIETRGGLDGQRTDLDWLRSRLGAS
jgi:deoxyribonuclease-4